MIATPSALTRYHEAVQLEMRAAFPDVALPIYDMARYALGWQDEQGNSARASGKGARAALTMLGAEAITDNPDALRCATAGAAAVEIVHNFSLVHDDVQDGDVERRGQADRVEDLGRGAGDQHWRSDARAGRRRAAPGVAAWSGCGVGDGRNPAAQPGNDADDRGSVTSTSRLSSARMSAWTSISRWSSARPER